MRKYEQVSTKQMVTKLVSHTCDLCGADSKDKYLIEVIISVNYGQEGGAEDSFDYCNDCFMAEIRLHLLGLGSKAEIVRGDDLGV
jgi:hypothetical protein